MNGAGPFVHDSLDGVSAAAALGAASEAGIDLAHAGPRLCRVEEIRADLAALERVDENALGPARDPGHALPLTLY